MTTMELETSAGKWERFKPCRCGRDVIPEKITDGEIWSLGPGHQTSPMNLVVSYGCRRCGEQLQREADRKDGGL